MDSSYESQLTRARSANLAHPEEIARNLSTKESLRRRLNVKHFEKEIHIHFWNLIGQ